MAGCANDTENETQERWVYGETYYEDYKKYLNEEYKTVCEETLLIWTPNTDWSYGEYNEEGYIYGIEYKCLKILADKGVKTGKCSNTIFRFPIRIIPKDWNSNVSTSELFDAEEVFIEFESYAFDFSAEGELRFEITEQVLETDYAKVSYEIYYGETCVAKCRASTLSEHFTIDWLEEYIKAHIEIWNNSGAI